MQLQRGGVDVLRARGGMCIEVTVEEEEDR